GCSDGDPCTLGDSCVSGLCASTPKDCTGGDLCISSSCVPGSGTCTAPDGPLACTPGSRRSSTCAAEWWGDDPANPGGTLSTKKECHEGDPLCDHHTTPGTCTFRVGLCFHVNENRLAKPCIQHDVREYRLQRPKLETDARNTTTLLNAILSIPGASLMDA